MFLGVISDLVEYDKKYQNIVENQLGIVIIAKDLDSATRLSHKVNRRYKVVSLDGDVVNVGGSLTGGSIIRQTKSIIVLKQELKRLIDNKTLLEQELEEIKKELEEVEEEVKEIEEQEF